MTNYLDTFISNHSFWAMAFSGIGVTAILGAIKFIKFIIKVILKHKPCNRTNESAPITANILESQSDTQLKLDINNILSSIKQDLSHQQEQTFLRYYQKYKEQICPDDAKELYNQYQTIHSEFMPDYPALLSNLVGLLEAIDE